MTYRFYSAILAAILWSSSAYSHHNASAFYLTDRFSTVEGVVTEFRLINPHSRIYLEVKTATGATEAWMAEGDAAAVLLRRGWTGGEIKKGDVIKVTGHPSRDGKKLIEWKSIVLPDGTEMGGGNGIKAEREQYYKELDKRRRAGLPPDKPSAPADKPSDPAK